MSFSNMITSQMQHLLDSVDETTEALMAAGFPSLLTGWLKELEDELAAAQMAMHNLIGSCTDHALGVHTQTKVAAFEQQLIQVSPPSRSFRL